MTQWKGTFKFINNSKELKYKSMINEYVPLICVNIMCKGGDVWRSFAVNMWAL
jgi:hypothetical protein